MGQVGRPRTQMERMTTIRVRESQRIMLAAMRLKGESNHAALTRILKHYLNAHRSLKAKVKRSLLEKRSD